MIGDPPVEPTGAVVASQPTRAAESIGIRDVKVKRLHREALVIDTHTHSATFLPAFAARALRWANRRTMPADVALSDVRPAVDAIVAAAVGDPIATVWWARPAWSAVDAQLRRVEAEARRAGATLARTADEVRRCKASGSLAVILGLEGGDAIGAQLDRLDELFQRGVRLIVVVHLGDNQIGTTCLPWQGYVGRLPVHSRRARGLTSFGRQVIERMNRLGMVVDVSHADRTTVRDIVEHSTAPVVASHAGARAVEDFERYLDDDEIAAIAARGGLIGLWPYQAHGHGPADIDALVAHARHIAELVGPDHLCLGTDMNGVPGVMAGYSGERDVPLITAHLLAAGLTDDQVRGVLGENFLRVLETVAQDRPTGPTLE
jgi:membrane dipeptidase